MTLTRRQVIQQAGLALAAGALPPGCTHSRPARSANDPFVRLDATAQAELVARGEVPPRELVLAAIERIEAVDGELNAVVTRSFERGLEMASRPLPEGPFRGVPFLFKDLMNWQGVRTTFGARFFEHNVSKHTDVPAARMLATGVVPLGKTNTPELGLLPTTQSRLLGPARNPWQLDHDPGGSSGGAAVAVAAGMVPLAQASDGGGSIRVPACNTGLFGMKPSRGRIPPRNERPGALSTAGCVTRSVRDSESFLRAVALRPDEGSPLPDLRAPRPPLGRLRIAFTTHDLYGGEAHADCIAAVERAARLCESLGHHVEEAAPDLDGERFIDHFLVFWSHTPRRLIDGLTAQLGAPPPRDAFEPWTWGLAERFHSLPDDALPRALAFAADAAQRMQAFHASFDLWLTPVLASPALRIGELDGSTPYAQALEEAITYVAFTPIANATGQPSMSVPLHWNDGGLPIGALFTGRVGAEATLFALAKQLETAQPWASRWPAVSALPG